MKKTATAALILGALALSGRAVAGALDEYVVKSDWFSMGGDVRVRQVGFNNIITWNSDNKADQQNFFRVRSRLYFQALPGETLKAYARFTNEWRGYIKPSNNVHPLRDEIILDNAYLALTAPDLNMSLTVGRQDLVYGEGFLILDGTTLDGSRTIFSDGGKLRIGVREGTDVDLLAFYNTGKQWFAINKNEDPLAPVDPPGRLDSQEIGLFGVYITDEALLVNQKIEAYYLFKYGQVSDVSPDIFPQNQISVFGARFSGPLAEGFKYGAEATGQLGSYGQDPQQAYGGYAHVTYDIPDVPASLTLGAVYLSGDDPDTSNHEGWDPILARWPKWSELYVYSLLPEKDIAYWSNMQIYQAILDLEPVQKLKVMLAYQYLRANEEVDGPVFGDGKERGQNPQVKVSYVFNDWLSAHVLSEYFIPGNFYSGDDDGFFARWEIMGKF
ncbi:MAG TPA: alginate export family protein [bacterium]|nr:alginate export family protein [bacterium]